MHRTRSVVIASVVLGLGISSFAVAQDATTAATGDNLREGVRNGTTSKETEIIGNINSSGGKTGGYVTRQSNKSSTGGGAIYGCRSDNSANAAPCVRANNLASGRAFEFNAASAPSAGTITVGTGGDTKKPFTTNATGVADGLNADRVDGQNAEQIVAAARAKENLDADTVDGQSASQIKSRWLLVNEAGQIEAQSGGFTIEDGYATNQNVYIEAGEDLSDNGLSATIAIRNVEGTNFGGEISASRCQIAGVINCAPAASKDNSSFVVSPRLSDGTATAADSRKRFYVTITG